METTKDYIKEAQEEEIKYRNGEGKCGKCGGKMIFISEGPEDQEATICSRYRCEDCGEVLLRC